MNRLLIKGGRVLDPVGNIDAVLDVLVEEGRIAAVGQNLNAEAQVLDASGQLVCPGFIDMHVHLRDPGEEYKEDMVSGTVAAAKGGFTAIACMPNTKPVMDSRPLVEALLKKADSAGCVRVYPICALSKGQQGEELAELGDMREAGAVAASDDGHPVQNGQLMRLALEYSRPFDMLIINHAEDKILTDGATMHEGAVSTLLGLRGMPAEAEELMVARDLMMARLTGGRLHIPHVSTKGAVELIAQYKAQGVAVTCEVTPHHLLLTDQLVRDTWYDTDTKVNPPLRSQEHVDALLQAVAEGVIDAIASDHAPHHQDDKLVEYDYAAFGISGLETSVSLMADRLVHAGPLTWADLVKLYSVHPARILGVEGGSLAEGVRADITIIAPEKSGSVKVEEFASRGRNTPFKGWKFKGAPWGTVVGGEVIMWESRLVDRKR